MARKPRTNRPTQTEIPGCEACTDTKLVALGNERIDTVDTENTAKKRRKEIDASIIDRMHILRLKVFRVGEKLFRINLKEAVKVHKVKDRQIETLDKADAEGA